MDLGCTCVDPDAVLVHAYQRQVAGDPKLQPKYLSALERIADDTGSSELQMEVVKARSLGCWTVEDELKAYHTIGIDCTTDTEAYDEDLISATFQSKLEGCRDPPERECLRDALKLIANARSSDLLQTLYSSTAEIPRQPMSLEKAYTVFDGSSAVSDDLIMGMYTVYVRGFHSFLYKSEWVGVVADRKRICSAMTHLAAKLNSRKLSMSLPSIAIVVLCDIF